ncbi:MAG: hypothetical protein AOA65_1395 [Candidatus Bathyarchaeota archaeon BA1]|nr:MAG: hypothetical protein AOA65_1395 [Candidatus Bathyarchaeota archaeon BA1]
MSCSLNNKIILGERYEIKGYNEGYSKEVEVSIEIIIEFATPKHSYPVPWKSDKLLWSPTYAGKFCEDLAAYIFEKEFNYKRSDKAKFGFKHPIYGPDLIMKSSEDMLHIIEVKFTAPSISTQRFVEITDVTLRSN